MASKTAIPEAGTLPTSPYQGVTFRSVLGNTRAKQHLIHGLTSGQVSHAYIFQGAAGTGKHLLAAAFAKALLCEDVAAGKAQDACGVCPSCRLMDSGNHPDVKWITLAQPASGRKTPAADQDDASSLPKSIGTARIREEIVQDMAVLPYRSARKIYLVEHAEKLTVSAQNALLKTIEEPPAYGVVVLLSESEGALLPTIHSRCVTVKLDPLSEDLLTKALISHGLPAREAASYASCCSGSLGLALLLSKDESFMALRKELYDFLGSLPNLTAMEVLRQDSFFSAASTPREQLFMLLKLWYRDLLILKTTGDASTLLCRDYEQAITAASRRYSLEQLLTVLKTIASTEEALSRSANALLAYDLLLTSLSLA